MYVYFRNYESESVMVIINNSSMSQTLDPKKYKECLCLENQGVDIITEREIQFNDFVIAPFSSYIISYNVHK